MALINYVTQIQLDFGAIALLKSECDRAGISKPLIVTDVGARAASNEETVRGVGQFRLPSPRSFSRSIMKSAAC
jgi:alcohol dehydrogenase class IV